MRIALLTTDSREHFREYEKRAPFFATAPSALLKGLHQLGNVEVHVISCVQARTTSPVQLAKNIWFHGLFVPKWGWLRTGYAGCILAVRRKLAEVRPDLVHAQGTERDCAISAAFCPGPKVLTIHGNCRAVAKFHHSRPFSYWWLQARLERVCIPRFNGVICISQYARTWVSGLAKKTWLVPNAVDPDFFRIQRAELSLPPTFLCVANIVAHKNQVGLIRALDSAPKKLKFQVRFFGRCGEDSYGTEFKGLVAQRSWCFWGGMINKDKLSQELSHATALIHPTMEDNCPMAILEAQAAGLPVLASNIGGIPDLIKDGETGILMNPSQPHSIVKAVLKVLGNKSLSSQVGKRAQKQARARFHPKVIAEKHLNIYREVIACR